MITLLIIVSNKTASRLLLRNSHYHTFTSERQRLSNFQYDIYTFLIYTLLIFTLELVCSTTLGYTTVYL